MQTDEDFTAWLVVRWPRLVRSAVLLGCSPAEAEDITQTALERCLLHMHKVQMAEDRDAYVHRVLVNVFISSRRRRWVGERPTADVPDHSAPDQTGIIDERDAVMRALGKLPVDQRTVIVLRYYSHLTEHQVAAALGVATGTVKSRLSRALKRLSQNSDLAELRGTP